MFSKAGRGGLDFTYNLAYDSAVWTPVGVTGYKSWQPSATWGWTADTNAITGYFTYNSLPRKCFDSPPGWYWSTVQNNFQYVDSAGVAHNFSNGSYSSTTVSDCSSYGSTGFTIPATDASGLVLVANGIDSYQVRYPNGRLVTPPLNTYTGSASLVDSNGNQITTTGSGFVDTTGTTVVSLSGSGTSSSPRLLTYPTYLSTGASTASVTVHYASYNVMTNFGCSGITEYSSTGVSLVDYVQLADGQEYQFSYEATPGYSGYVTGRLAQITMPGGGRIQYGYSGGSNGIECQDGGTATLTRSMLDDPASSLWTYTRTPGSGAAANSHTEVVDGTSKHATYDFVNDSTDANLTPYVVSYSQYNGAVSGTPLLAELTCYNGATTCVGESLTLPITATSITTTLDGSSVKNTTQAFSSYGMLTNQTDYDYGSGSPGAQVDQLTISYGTTFVDLPTNISVYGNSSAPLQVTYYYYDSSTPSPTSGLPQHVSAGTARGNLSSKHVLLNGGWPMTTLSCTYDDAGQVLTSMDAKNNTTSYTYDSGTDTFVQGISMPSTGTTIHTTSAQYDVPSGVLRSSTDQNSQTTSYTYDNMLRVVGVGLRASGSMTYTYSLASTTPSIQTSTLHATGTYINNTQYLDGYGRLIKTGSTDTPSDDLVSYVYDANGRLGEQSTPYRTGRPNYVQYAYDGLGRVWQVTDSDGVGQSSATYSGNTVLTLDEASKKRKIITDALGRISQVLEPDASNSLTLETDYAYDQNQTAGTGYTPTTYQTVITQKGGSSSSSDWRVRTFTYDMPGRMVSSATPEEGTISYTFITDSSGCAGDISLICTRTDANSTTSTYSYDALNRLTGKTYSGSTIASVTSSVAYSYDQTSYNGLTINYGNGLRTGMSDGSGATAWSYDAAGNVAAIRKTINSVTKQANYAYNADYTINTAQDFGGTILTYSYNAAGLPTQVIDGSGNIYAASAVYNAAGQLNSVNHQLTSGGAAYVRSWQYNSRLQPSVISATLNGSTIQSLSYGYGGSGTNNGNILSITNAMDSTRTQSYSYDNLNRLASGNDGTHWGENYTYDNWGNLYQISRMSGYSGPNNWSVSADAHNHLSNLGYDSAGNVTYDQYTNSLQYDAEGRMIWDDSYGESDYDGDGHRVYDDMGATLYWYGPFGLMDESNSSGTIMAKQVDFGGLRVWSEDIYGGARFLFHDHLGSVRMTGDASGNLKDDYDYLPFGTTLANYGPAASGNHYRFTGYQEDLSDGSADYAVFRTLNAPMGRFNRPDPYNGSYDPANPQSYNRYAYIENSPLIAADRTGLLPTCNGGGDDDEGCYTDEPDYSYVFGFGSGSGYTGYGQNPGGLAQDGRIQDPPRTPNSIPEYPRYDPNVLVSLRGGGSGSLGAGGGGSGSGNNNPQKKPQPQKQPWYCGKGNSWSHPFTAPTGRQWGKWSTADLGAAYAISKFTKGLDPVSEILTASGLVEAWGWAACD